MATLAPGQDARYRRVPWSPRAWRQALYLALGIPAQLLALALVVVPWWAETAPSWHRLLGERNWGKVAPIPLFFLAIVFFAVPAFTALQRYRVRVTAGVAIPPQPALGHRWSR